jgi:hypothetical protein
MKRILESGRRGGVRARCETVGAMTHIDMYTALLHSHLSKAVARRVLGIDTRDAQISYGVWAQRL